MADIGVTVRKISSVAITRTVLGRQGVYSFSGIMPAHYGVKVAEEADISDGQG
jgi:hypothetical protein